MIELHLPYPPSVNHYWKTSGKRRYISAAGKAFRFDAHYAWHKAGSPTLGKARVRVSVALYPPDRRRRDVDNSAKCVLDALEAIGVFDDDEQVDDLRFVRCERVEGGACIVMIEPIEQGEHDGTV